MDYGKSRGGWMGKVLVVDLTAQRVDTVPLEKPLAENYIGGRGFTSKKLYDLLGPKTDALGPDNVLLFAAGPLVGTPAPSGTRWTVAAKSPLTGAVGDGNGGGFLGLELKRAGFDGVVIKGVSERPVYLAISGEDVRLMDASHLWGLEVAAAERAIRSELRNPNVHIASIGPGGEKLVRFATVISDNARGAGRCGMGAVMGSKRLKAVAITGKGSVKVADPARLEKFIQSYKTTLMEGDYYELMSTYGTPYNITHRNRIGVLGTRNHQTTVFEGVEKLTAERLEESYFVKSKACFSCPLACNHYFIGFGPGGPFYGSKLEFAATGHLGAMCGNSDLGSVVQGVILANKYGIDIISTGSTIAYAMECYERGLLTKKDTDGIELTWGNSKAILQLIEKIGKREGFGDLLAEGSYRFAQKLGGEALDFVLQVKGMEPPMNDPRGLHGYGLGYAVASRGGDHCRATPYAEFGIYPPAEVKKLFGSEEAADPLSYSNKGRLLIWYEDSRAAQEVLGLCKFLGRVELGKADKMAELFNIVTGLEVDGKELFRVGERLINTDRMFNMREGFTRKDDTLPKRFLEEPLTEGPAKGQTINLEPMLDEYYELRGWEKETGLPTREKLIGLGLEDVAGELEKYR